MKIIIIHPPFGSTPLDQTDSIKLRAEDIGGGIKIFRDLDPNRKAIIGLIFQREKDEGENLKFTCIIRPVSPHDAVITAGHDIDVVATRSSEDETVGRIHLETLTYRSNYDDAAEVTDKFKIQLTSNSAEAISIQFPIVVKPPEGPP